MQSLKSDNRINFCCLEIVDFVLAVSSEHVVSEILYSKSSDLHRASVVWPSELLDSVFNLKINDYQISIILPCFDNASDIYQGGWEVFCHVKMVY